MPAWRPERTMGAQGAGVDGVTVGKHGNLPFIGLQTPFADRRCPIGSLQGDKGSLG